MVSKTIVFLLFLCISSLSKAEVKQEGSLNSFTGEGATVSSNNNTTDTSSTTQNTYNGAGSSSQMPVGSAISPSYMSSGMDTCLKGTGGSLQTLSVGFSSGGYTIDEGCTRRRDSKLLSDLSMKIPAIARMCQDLANWKAMLVSATPCPLLSNGKIDVGKRAFLMMRRQPEVYIPDYNKDTKDWYDTILNIGAEETDEEDTNISVITKFRSSIK